MFTFVIEDKIIDGINAMDKTKNTVTADSAIFSLINLIPFNIFTQLFCHRTAGL